MFRTAARALRQQRRCIPQPVVSRLATRTVGYGAAHMSSTLAPVQPPLPSTRPTDSFQLLKESEKPDAEQEIFDQQIQEVKEWWSSPRYKGIKRPYSPEDVVSKRGSLQQVYPSSLMARKLFNLLEERYSQKQPVHTSRLPSKISNIQFNTDLLPSSGCC